MVGSGGSFRSCVLSANLGAYPSAYYLESGNQTSAQQEETGRLGRYFDLASDLATGEVGVVNVGVGVSTVQRGDEAGFR